MTDPHVRVLDVINQLSWDRTVSVDGDGEFSINGGFYLNGTTVGEHEITLQGNVFGERIHIRFESSSFDLQLYPLTDIFESRPQIIEKYYGEGTRGLSLEVVMTDNGNGFAWMGLQSGTGERAFINAGSISNLATRPAILNGENSETVISFDPTTQTVSGLWIRSNDGTPLLPVAALRETTEPSKSQLANLSVRAETGSGERVLTAGFVDKAFFDRRLLIRAIGPTLTSFGVETALAEPILAIFEAETRIAENNGWENSSSDIASASSRLGAFPLPTGSRDSAILFDSTGKVVTARVEGAAGIALIELYADDTAENPTGRMTNLSVRAWTGAGPEPLVGGFVVRGESPMRLLIRAVGPTLSNFGVTQYLPNPTLTIFSNGQRLESNQDWSTDPLDGGVAFSAFSQVGAFPLDANSGDSVILTTVDPGVYSAHVTSEDEGEGIVLLEVYEVP